jgi:hypothetical protein
MSETKFCIADALGPELLWRISNSSYAITQYNQAIYLSLFTLTRFDAMEQTTKNDVPNNLEEEKIFLG